MMITVYGRNTSVNVQAVMWCIAELGLDHERLDFGGAFGKTDTAEYRAMNPNGLVPTIKDERNGGLGERGDCAVSGLQIWRRGILAARSGQAGAARHVGGMDALDDLSGFHLDSVYSDGSHGEIGARTMRAVAAAEVRLKANWALLDARIGKGPWLNGGALLVCRHWLRRDACTGCSHLSIDRPDVPNVQAYYERLLARPAYAPHVADFI